MNFSLVKRVLHLSDLIELEPMGIVFLFMEDVVRVVHIVPIGEAPTR